MTENTKNQPPSKWKTWVLILSLSTNLLVIGLVAGFVLSGPQHKGPKRSHPDGLRSVFAAVPESKQEDLRRALGDHRQERRAIGKRIGELRPKLIAALENPQFNRTDIETIFEEHIALISSVTSGGHAILLDSIEAMSLEERQAFAQNLRKRPEKQQSKPSEQGQR